MRLRTVLPAALLASLLLHAGDTPRERATLKGAKVVGVVVEPMPDDLPKLGVTADALQARLAGRLRDAGIPLDDSATEFIGLRVASARETRGPYAVVVRLGFYQAVTLVRDPTVRAAPETWAEETVLMAAPKMVFRTCVDGIDDLADRFIAAWRSANPQ